MPINKYIAAKGIIRAYSIGLVNTIGSYKVVKFIETYKILLKIIDISLLYILK